MLNGFCWELLKCCKLLPNKAITKVNGRLDSLKKGHIMEWKEVIAIVIVWIIGVIGLGYMGWPWNKQRFK